MVNLSQSILSYGQVGNRSLFETTIPDIIVNIATQTGAVYNVEPLMGSNSTFLLLTESQVFTVSHTGVVICNTALTLGQTETLLILEEKEDLSAAVVRSFQFNNMVPKLTLSSIHIVVNTAFSINILGIPTGFTIEASASDETPLVVVGSKLQGKFTTPGPKRITLVAENFNLTNASFPSDSISLTVLAFEAGKLDFSKPVNANLMTVLL